MDRLSSGERRLATARRKAVGLRLRRIVPGLLVSTTTLAGTGGLAAWVAGQPGVKAAVQPPILETAHASQPAGSGPPLASLQRQLQAEEAALKAIQARLARARSGSGGPAGVAAASSRGPSGPSGSGGGSYSQASAAPSVALGPLPTIPVLAPVSMPAPSASSSPPPPTAATTGASHAVP